MIKKISDINIRLFKNFASSEQAFGGFNAVLNRLTNSLVLIGSYKMRREQVRLAQEQIKPHKTEASQQISQREICEPFSLDDRVSTKKSKIFSKAVAIHDELSVPLHISLGKSHTA